MLKKCTLLILAIFLMYGVSFAQDVSVPLTFTWQHNVPPDIAKYDLKEVAGPTDGTPTGTVYTIPYTFTGETNVSLTHGEQITIPVETQVEKCYVVSASDLAGNESGDSGIACASLFAEDEIPPDGCTSFEVTFPGS